MAEAVVPESSRYCAVCDAAVGRGRDDRPGRTEGFCPQCGTRFSFTPTLRAGDLVAGQYEILGALAHGGLGWVYLARDRKVRDRWVVLKGLLNTGDAAALAAADAEQGFLAQLVHPRIVRIYNVVTGDDGATYIVMEYIGGRSLKAMRDPREPMAPEQALAYVLEVLPALSHMHERGLLYCDFKPDNVVQTGTDVTLIDLGAVRRMDEPGGDVWGTVGYQAPEISPDGVGPSVASDVYTVGRTLAVLVATFDFHRSMRDRLPDPHDAPALTHEPLRRLLARATDRDPARRFVSIDEMSDQMIGVLRRLTARRATPPPRLSTMFAAPSGAAGITAPVTPEELADTMPAPRPDPDDPATPELVAAAAQGPRAVLAAVSGAGCARQRPGPALRRRRPPRRRRHRGRRPGPGRARAARRVDVDVAAGPPCRPRPATRTPPRRWSTRSPTPCPANPPRSSPWRPSASTAPPVTARLRRRSSRSGSPTSGAPTAPGRGRRSPSPGCAPRPATARAPSRCSTRSPRARCTPPTPGSPPSASSSARGTRGV